MEALLAGKAVNADDVIHGIRAWLSTAPENEKRKFLLMMRAALEIETFALGTDD